MLLLVDRSFDHLFNCDQHKTNIYNNLKIMFTRKNVSCVKTKEKEPDEAD